MQDTKITCPYISAGKGTVMLQSSLNPGSCFHIYFLKKDRHNTFFSLFSPSKNYSSAVSRDDIICSQYTHFGKAQYSAVSTYRP